MNSHTAYSPDQKRERVNGHDFHSLHRGVDIARKKLSEALDIYRRHGRIANGSALPKSAGPCRGFTVGSEILQRVDPIVRSLISTG